MYKGRIVVYSIVGCPHCLAAKSRLQNEGLQYVDVSVDRYPPRIREWVKNKTGKSSVPQIFFNSTYVGGNVELVQAFEDEEKKEELLKEIRENEAPEGDDAPLLPHPSDALEQIDDNEEEEFHCEEDEYSILINTMKEEGLLKSHKKGLFSSLNDSFTGKEFVDWVLTKKEITREKAVEMGQEVIGRSFVLNTRQQVFKDDSSLYQLGNSDSGALNAGDPTCVARPAGEMSKDIRNVVLKLFAQFLSSDGKFVDYKGMASSPRWTTFKKMATELQRVNLDDISDDEKLAFFINIYNVLVIHGTVEKGTPTSTYKRYKFFSTVSYILGGQVYSLNDIENGVLRSNRSSMATLYCIPFGKADPRLTISLGQVEPRIHFALNCGAKSCPPIKTFSGDDIQNQLQVATAAFLETDEALLVDVSNKEVKLTQLFEWYSKDFGDDKKEILGWIHERVEEPGKKAALGELLEDSNVKVSYIPYDWGHNSKE